MATREFVEERILKAQETLTKKQGTLARHQKALEKLTKKAKEMTPSFTSYSEAWEHRNDSHSAWEACCVWSDVDSKMDDIKRTEKAIAEVEAKLADYQAQLQIITEKENSRNVKVIIDFLENWKHMVHDFYMEAVNDYHTARQELNRLRAVRESFMYGSQEYKEADEEVEVSEDAFRKNLHGFYEERTVTEWVYNYRTRKNELKTFQKEVKVRDGKWEFASRYLTKDIAEGEALLNKDLKKEAEAKYDDIIERTNQVVGQITDASRLECNEKGNLDGIIIGTKGTAKVETIGAGGYNIQCFHFRTLINKLK